MRRGGRGVAAASPLTNPHIPTPNQPPPFNLTPHFSRPLEPHSLPPFLPPDPSPPTVVLAQSCTWQPAPPPPRPCHLPPTVAAAGGEGQGRGWCCRGSRWPPFPRHLPPNIRSRRGEGDGGGGCAEECCWRCLCWRSRVSLAVSAAECC
ncbi:unnamed protein product, partial [Closterium sp. NIES-54]